MTKGVFVIACTKGYFTLFLCDVSFGEDYNIQKT